jgi:hypothetical protein
MNKNSKKKVSNIILIILMILSTLLVLTTFANATNKERSLEDAQSYSAGDQGTENGYIPLQELYDRYALVCSEHGVHFPSYNNTVIKDGSGNFFTYNNQTVSKPYLTQNDKGTKVFVTTVNTESETSDTPFTTGPYTSETFGYYKITDTHIATPMEAYILSEMVKETDSSALEFEEDSNGNTYIQNAWWTTTFGSQGPITVSSNALSEEAKAFEDYIIKAGGSTDTSTYTLQDYEFTANNVTYTGQVKAPVIEYNPEYVKDVNDDGTEDELTVSWNDTEQKYLIGPFRVDYLESGILQFGDRPEVMFAGITDSKLYYKTNDGEEKEVPKENWEFVWLADQRDANDDYEYPHTTEVFYVAMDYIKDAIYFSNLHFDFKYMNAGGSYDELQGTYFKATWTPKEKSSTCTSGYSHTTTNENGEEENCDHPCSHGHTYHHIESWTYWLELTGLQECDSQLLAYGIEGARWYYDDATLDYDKLTKFDEYSATLNIKKIVVDESGNEVSPSDDEEFTFRVKINGEVYSTITLKANETWSKKITWKQGETAPTYEVTEINVPDGYTIRSISNASGTFENGKNSEYNVTGYNTIKSHEGYIRIIKKVTEEAIEQEVYKFNVYVAGELVAKPTITINPGQTSAEVVLGPFTWNGKTAPTYKVTETEIPENVTLFNMINEKGRLNEGTSNNPQVTVTAINNNGNIEKSYSGTITVTKIVNGTSSSDAKFEFKITIGDITYTKWLGNGESWSENIKWTNKTGAPTYKVEEVTSSNPEDYYFVEMKNSKGTVDGNVTYGTMEENSTIAIKCYNEIKEKEHQAAIKVTKKVEIDDKVKDEAIDGTFKFEITISGSFEMNGESVEGSKKITQSLSAGESYTTPTITWKGDKAPTYSVKEIELPEGWSQKDMTNPGGTLIDGETVETICTNQFPIDVQYELTMQMGGVVWNDKALNPDDKNTENSVPNGVYDAGAEEGIEKVEVTIKRYLVDSSGNIVSDTGNAIAYNDDGSEISWPVYTDIDGVWSVPKVEMTALKEGESGTVRYGVEFVYDGQTYMPTTFLTTANGNASTYMKSSRTERGNYFYDSMALEEDSDRVAFNNKFANITGDDAIDANGSTTGYSTNTSGSKTATLDYISTDSLNTTGSTRKVSSLVTRDSDNYFLDDFKIKANTITGGLTFPFDSTIHLESINKTIDALGLHYKYKYSATYPYLQSINLGLVVREEAEVAATKDVYSTAVVVNQKMLNYEFNQAIDFENVKYQDYLNLQVEVADANIEYQLDLYKSDYYYRASIYDTNSSVKGALQKFYKSLGYTSDNALENELELDVFVTYKLSVYNDSQSYYATINEIADYFDDDYELVSTDTYRYLEEANGVEVDKTTLIAQAPYYEVVSRQVNGNTVTWDTAKEQKPVTIDSGSTSITGSDGKTYTRITTKSIANEMLASGERIDLYLTFKVKTDEMSADGILNCTRLGEKANVFEITNYSTYNSNNKSDYAGRVDKDSAPNNVNISEYNEKEWYEDDTDSAPIITLELYNTTREISGVAWEDKENTAIDDGYGQLVGNGIYDEGEQLIGNLTTELWEKLRIKQIDDNGNEVKDSNGKTVYTDYDFLWPEDYEIQEGKTLKELTGFDSTTKTSNEDGTKGQYEFTGIPTGNYAVRFVYGDSDETSSPANYDGDGIPAVYNGQDFKTTAYQSGFETITDSNSDGYVDNEWHNLENDDLANARVSDARDSETRRLEITALSRILTNSNTTILNTANSKTADHTELYNQYYMYAETAKINLSIEDMVSLKKQKVNVTNQTTGTTEEVTAGEEKDVGGVAVSYVKGKVNLGNGGNSTIERLDFTYTINNIDVGLEERASTEIKLDKQIENIKLIDNTGSVILNADYDITYTPTYDSSTGRSSVVANAELNKATAIGTDKLQALNRNEEAGLQNFRYIYFDNSIAQSLTLNVTYKFTVLNLGEVDRIGLLSSEKFDDPSVILTEAQKLAEPYYSYDSLSKTFTKTANSDGSVYGNTYGKYLGSIYYQGNNGKTNLDDIVTTRIDQLIDYVDNNAVFRAAENTSLNSSWRIVTIEELSNSDIIDKNVIITYDDGTKNIEDDNGLTYQSDERHNIILSVENKDSSATEMSNKDFNVKLVPYSATKACNPSSDLDYNYTSEMKMYMTRSIDAGINDDDLSFDNVAEIVKLDNTAGRRDVTTIAGNSNPKEGEFATALKERDSSATELITFSPPTGISARENLTIQIALVSIAALGIVAVGIVFIKKKVLK